MVFVLLGRAGGGKTETSAYFAKRSGLGIPAVPLGNIMHSWAKKGHPIAQQCMDAIKKGKYFSAEWSIQILREYLQQHPKQFRNGFILDGFPRKVADIPAFEDFLGSRGFAMGGIIHFEVSLPVSNLRQFQRKREIEAIAPRQKEFDEKEAPVIEYYRKKGMVRTIDTNPNQKVRVRRGEFAPHSLSYLQHYSARLKKIVKGKIPRRR